MNEYQPKNNTMHMPMRFDEVYDKVKCAAAIAAPKKQRILAETCLDMVLNNLEVEENEGTWLNAKGYAAIVDARNKYKSCSADDADRWIQEIDEGYLGDGDMSSELLFILETLTAWEMYLRTANISAIQDICEIMLNFADCCEQAPLDDFLASSEVAKEYKRIMSILE